jgi:membrane protein implicated in regulation of membrane protease activity
MCRSSSRRSSRASGCISCTASFEEWIDRPNGLARVSYRGASWEATVEGDAALERGTLVYVLSSHGNTLQISKTRPA